MRDRKKWKTYKLEPVLDKLPPEMKCAEPLYYFIGRFNREAEMTLTVAGYKAIMKKDGDHFTDLWEYVSR